ncbi:hypothetical protein LSCM1_07316 [Leishmania martiniquensis]|uniref:Uncharacterized protein n=1 Tax=Leishmania martiniquensis TaxID=1580590 RepID=A0A836H3H6_9TRYP|nr:hypothetical protein LSCM1_07316 [Leishmania martiniquensis]
MPPSQVRKDEAELRQIAKRSRLARKEAQQRERKRRERTQRAAAKSGGAVSSAAEAATASAPKRRRGAIVLPDEVQELRQRLMSDDVARSASEAGALDGRKKKSAGAKKAARSLAKKTAGAAWASSHSATPSSSALVPSYHEEVHFKKKMLCVDVVLHHVPYQKIDISETNTHQLVVDTCGHTKKYRLVLPYPKEMRCDAAAATYEYENGILQCRLPIVDGAIPAELEAENEQMMEKMRQQRALRFRVTQNGDLTVRTRQALLTPTPAAHDALLAAKKAPATRGSGASSDNDAISAGAHVMGEGEKTANRKSRKRDRDNGEGGDEETQRQPRCAPAKGEATDGENAAPKEAAATRSKPDVFEAEHARAMEAARVAAAKVSLSLRERVLMAKKVQASREERLKTRTLRRERKEEQRQKSFHRVLEEQKRQLLTRASMQPPVLRPAPQTKTSAKSVRFADT